MTDDAPESEHRAGSALAENFFYDTNWLPESRNMVTIIIILWSHYTTIYVYIGQIWACNMYIVYQ